MPDPDVGEPYHLDLTKSGNTVTVVFTCTGSISNIDTTSTNEITTGTNVLTTSTNLLDLHTRTDSADHNNYILYIKDGKFVDPMVNIFALTYTTRETPGDLAAREGYMTLLGIGTPSNADPSTDYIFAVLNTSSTLTLNGDIELVDAPMTWYNQGMHRVVLGPPVYNSSTQIMSFAVTIPDTDSTGSPIDNTVPLTLEVSSTVGNVLQSEVPIVNGSGTIYISLLNYPSGLAGKLKTGFKFWTRKAVAYFTTP